ncbi:PleD family two-component system response regulator [Chloroflexota bacterium]
MEKKAKILIVDDDADFVESTRIVLESKPYDVIVAVDGNDGLRKAKEEKPDLVLLDVIMPVKDGFTAAEQFKEDAELSKIPVLMLTSFSTKGGETGLARSRGYGLEAEDYIDKPVSPEELLKRVDKQLKKIGF